MLRVIYPILFVVFSLSCEIDTKLKISGGNPPVFHMSGNGILTSIRVAGHETQRKAQGEDQNLYWVIEAKAGGADHLWKLSSVTYGKVPEGYKQIYPEKVKPRRSLTVSITTCAS